MADAELPPLLPGDVVESLKGRDRGTVAVVWGLIGRGRAAIVDGSVHPIARPKPKNRRHLRALGHEATVAHRMVAGQGLSDGEIQAVLKPFRDAMAKRGQEGAEDIAGEGGSRDGEGG